MCNDLQVKIRHSSSKYSFKSLRKNTFLILLYIWEADARKANVPTLSRSLLLSEGGSPLVSF